MKPLSFKCHRFPPDIIRRAIWLYGRFTLSFRDVEKLLAERGIDVSYETVRRWVLKFGPAIAANIRRSRPRPSDHWHLDEMVITIRGDQYWLWRAIDNEGEVLDFLVQRRRNAKVAKKLMIKLLKRYGFAPTRIVTDRLRTYPAAFRAIGLTAGHDRGLRAIADPSSFGSRRSSLALGATLAMLPDPGWGEQSCLTDRWSCGKSRTRPARASCIYSRIIQSRLSGLR